MQFFDYKMRTAEERSISVLAMEDDHIKHDDEVEISEFDYSVDRYFDVNDKISSLWESTSDEQVADVDHIKRFSSMVTFLPEWRYLQYEPLKFKFDYELGSLREGEDGTSEVHLSQFSSASVPKRGRSSDKSTELNSKDFLLHAGGSVWSLDWCPRVKESHDSCINFEYLAASVHPPDSTHHQMGLPLTGKGIIQVWGIVSVKKEGTSPSMYKFFPKGRGRPRKRPLPSENELDLVDESTTCLPNTARESPSKQSEYFQMPRKRPLPSKNELDLVDENTTCLPNTARESPSKQSESFETPNSVAVRPRRSRQIPRKLLDYIGPAKISNEVVTGLSEAQPKKPRGRPKKPPGSASLGCAGLKEPESSDSTKISNDLVSVSPEAYPRKPIGGPKMLANLGCSSLQNCHEDYYLNLIEEDGVSSADSVCPNHRKKQYVQGSNGIRDPCSRKDSSSFDQVSASVFARLPVMEGMDLADVTLTSPPSVAKTVYPPAEQQYSRKRGRPRKNPPNDFSSICTAQTVNPSCLTCLSTSGEGNHAFPLKPSGHMVSHEGGRETGNLHISYDENSNHYKYANPISGKSVQLPSKNCPVENHESVENSNLEGRNLIYFSSEPNLQNSHHVGCLSKKTSGKVRNSERKLKNGACLSNGNAFSMNAKSYNDYMPDRGSQDEGSLFSCYEDGDKIKSQKVNNIIHKDTMPRIIFCLAHMGKVAWDVKWRPAAHEFTGRYTMGFLAVLLGCGSLEVWEVPLPSLIKKLYTSINKEGIDPRFLSLQPVFKCSKLIRGGKLSIPLVLEWTPSPPYDLIVAGCHDGSVALWKFQNKDHGQDSKPLAYFSAGHDPIRALAWCPDERDGENFNLFVTAGPGGLKFWDIRDPYRPLWCFNPVQRHVLSVDWLKDSRCILVSYDDGDLRIICLQTAISDSLVMGKVFGGSKPRTHTLAHSSFAVWSAQASCVVACCCADGSTKRFELTVNNIENIQVQRVRKFLCGSLMTMGTDLLIHTPLLNHPLPITKADLKQPQNKVPNKAVCIKDKITASKQKSRSKAEGGVHEKKEIVCSMGEEPFLNPPSEAFTPLRAIESFPSKRVAMHKVRWNKNRGSEQWLCYGGAAGIIRCQEITWPIP